MTHAPDWWTEPLNEAKKAHPHLANDWRDLPDDLMIAEIPIKDLLAYGRYAGFGEGIRREAYEIAVDWRKSQALAKAKKTNTDETAYRVIRALVLALSDAYPDELKKDGSPFIGYSKDKDRGIVGFLVEKGYTELKTTALEKAIRKSLDK